METITILCNTHKLGDIELYDNSAFLDVPSETYKIAELRAIAAALTGAADKLEQKDGAWVKGETTIVVARPAAKPRFKVGDRVRSKLIGLVGHITRIYGTEARVEASNGNYCTAKLKDLELAPEPAPEPAPADTTAWWEAMLKVLPLADETRDEDIDTVVARAARIATAAVEARRKMMEWK